MRRDLVTLHVGMRSGGSFWVYVNSAVALETAGNLRRLGADWLALIWYAETGPEQAEWVWRRQRGQRGMVLTQPTGNCDGSKKYKYDPSKDNGRGAPLAQRCSGCRACQ